MCASSQLFVPMGLVHPPSLGPRAVRYLVVVARATGLDQSYPDLTTLRAFVARGGMGINYAAGVWHAPMICLEHTTGTLRDIIDYRST